LRVGRWLGSVRWQSYCTNRLTLKRSFNNEASGVCSGEAGDSAHPVKIRINPPDNTTQVTKTDSSNRTLFMVASVHPADRGVALRELDILVSSGFVSYAFPE